MSALDELTKGILETKKTKAAKLTPVKGEEPATVRGIPDVPEVFLTNEAVADVSRDLRKQAAKLVEVADALDLHTGTKPTDAFTVKLTAQAARLVGKDKPVSVVIDEDQPDPAKFAAQYAAQQEAAQAAVFAAADDGAEETAPADGWVCPDHGATNLLNTVSGKGRQYTLCQVAGCDQFEK